MGSTGTGVLDGKEAFSESRCCTSFCSYPLEIVLYDGGLVQSYEYDSWKDFQGEHGGGVRGQSECDFFSYNIRLKIAINNTEKENSDCDF